MKISILLIALSFAVFAKGQMTAKKVFYFQNNSVNLVDESQIDLVHFLDSLGTMSCNRIVVNGYADIAGRDSSNYLLSLKRAKTIEQALNEKDRLRAHIEINAFGSSNLVTTDEKGQQLNRRVEVFFTYEKNEGESIKVSPVFEDVAEQRFLVNMDDTVYIEGSEGTRLKIEPNSIRTRSGQIVKGNAEILVKEYYKPGDILLAGLTSDAEKGLLQSGGMFHFIVKQDGDTLDYESQKPIRIRMPVLNEELSNMSVFSTKADTVSQWTQTSVPFNQLQSYWSYPYVRKLNDFFLEDYKAFLTNLKVGRTYSDEYQVAAPISLSRKTFRDKPTAKKVSYTLNKTDSNTVSINIKIKYRNRGRRYFQTRYFDTTCISRYFQSEYEGTTDQMRWINCDRFYKYKEKIDFYVNTPGFEGMNVMVYFKKIHSYLQAYYDGSKFLVSNIPPNQPVILVAMGKKDGQYYFGKHEFTTASKTTTIPNITPVSKEDLRAALAGL